MSAMICVFRPTNNVELALAESLLREAQIPYYVQNANFASLFPGLPVDLFSARVMVAEELKDEAERLLQDL